MYSAEQVKSGEIKAAAKLNIAMYELMERAGKAVFDVISQHYPQKKRWLVYAGAGNNGGDAYVVARLAKETGTDVSLIAVSTSKTLSGDAAQAQQAWLDCGGQIINIGDHHPEQDDLIIDGLLGTGVSREVEREYKAAVQQINESNCIVVSIDVPSGIDADTGRVWGEAVVADITVTFIGVKSGLVTGSGRGHVGALVFDDLGVGVAFQETTVPKANHVNFAMLPPLPKRKNHTYKGECGKLLCIGSNKGMAGAIRLSGEAALRCGAGLVKVLCHESNVHSVLSGRPELMVSGDISELGRLYEWADVVVVGPGLGRNDWSRAVLNSLLALSVKAPKPMVVDADALSMSDHFPQFTKLKSCVMTPHSGEAARMLGQPASTIEENRYESATQLAAMYGATIVLKGAGTIVDDQLSTWVCEDGNPGMATAGMGDVLCGVLGALLANGLSIKNAVTYAVCIHSHAADIIAAEKGPKGLLASDLFEPLRRLVNFDNAVSTNNERR